jgi:hypothetical protein
MPERIKNVGRFVDLSCNFAIYNAPKGGGTTLRSWIYFAKTGEMAVTDEGNGYINQGQKTFKYLADIGYEVCNFIPWSIGPSVCIVRNPVDRFISLYMDKVVREKKCGDPHPSFREFCRNFATIIQTNDHAHGANPALNYLEHHFSPLSLIFGEDKGYYDKIFDISEINTLVKPYLEKQWGLELPSLHCRRANQKEKIIPDKEELRFIEEIYEVDLSLNWISRCL